MHFYKRIVITVALCNLAGFAGITQSSPLRITQSPPLRLAQSPLRLWYKEPAQRWEACLPLGNGRLGMTPDGGVATENIVLNDITLWSGSPQDANNYEANKSLPEIRRLLFEGKNDEAQQVVEKNFICRGPGSGGAQWGCFQMLGSLKLELDYGAASSDNAATAGGAAGNGAAPAYKNYHRQLSLDSAIATCTYEVDGVHYKKEYFTSYGTDVMIVRITADKPGRINCAVSLDRPEKRTISVAGNVLQMEGQLDNGTDGKGMKYLARVKAVLKGGSQHSAEGKLLINGATELLLYISAATDFLSPAALDKVGQLLTEAARLPYGIEKQHHVTAYKRLFDRVSLNLGPAVRDDLPTDERLLAFQKLPQEDNGMAVLFYQFGRYLSISSTRVGLLPPNLQGLWANQIHTPWNGDYHLDVNVEMNHWGVDVSNLSELDLPLAHLVEQMVPNGEKTARAYYQANGWVAHVITNPWHFTEPGESASWGAAKCGSGWLCNNLWQYYEFTNDTAYLRRMYPVLKGAAAFYKDMLIRDPKSGLMVSSPSSSPENAFLLPNGNHASICIGPTIDNQIIRELFGHVILASRLLHTDAAFRDTLEAQLPQMPPPGTVAPDGRLMEWMEDYPETEVHHRHISHLYGLYPANLITPDSTPVLAAACKKTLDARGDDGPSWSIAYKMLWWSRLYDGNRAYKLFKDLMRPTLATNINYGAGGGIYPNLFSAGPPFQIDANFGGEAGIAEMLIQSHAGYIHLLPAIPAAWQKEGAVKGLKARGNFIVDFKWKDGKITSYHIYSKKPHPVKVMVNGNVHMLFAKITMPRIFGDNMVLQRDRPLKIWGAAAAGETIVVSFHGQSRRTLASNKGIWTVTLDPVKYGGPFEMTISGSSDATSGSSDAVTGSNGAISGVHDTIRYKNVLVGDVWVCSGQSNMEFPVSGWSGVINAPQEIANAEYPAIRLFNVQMNVSAKPEDDIKGGEWKECHPSTISPFSAVGYFFGRELYRSLNIPIGLLASVWGGTDIETWISRNSLDSSAEFHDIVKPYPDSLAGSKLAGSGQTGSGQAGGRLAGSGQAGPNSAPSLLYNAMINPITPFPVKGFIWYQGENNAKRAYQYRTAMPLLIEDWRAHWKQSRAPFYFVQLTSFNAANGNSNAGSTWAELREAQTLTLSLPNTGMAVTTDVGDPHDIHPKNKQDVGHRLAVLALKNTYGKVIVANGPSFHSMTISGNQAELSFTGTGSGLAVRGDLLKGFEVAGADKKFYPATATLRAGNKVLVSSADVAHPVAVRYAWVDDASSVNLINKEGFPATPFRTDHWPEITRDVKYHTDL